MNQGFEAFERGFVCLSDLAQGRGNPFGDAGQFLQVERTSCFGSCAGQTVSAEGLYADDCTDDVAVDVNVAGFDAAADVAYRAFDAAVYAVGQGVAFAVDLVDDAVEFVGAVADDVQDGPKTSRCSSLRLFNSNRMGRTNVDFSESTSAAALTSW